MTGKTLTLTETSHENVRDHVINVIHAQQLDYALNPKGGGDRKNVPELVEVVVAYLLRGVPVNGVDVYFARKAGLTADERLAMQLITTSIKISLDEELAYLPGVVARIKRLEHLLDGGRP